MDNIDSGCHKIEPLDDARVATHGGSNFSNNNTSQLGNNLAEISADSRKMNTAYDRFQSVKMNTGYSTEKPHA